MLVGLAGIDSGWCGSVYWLFLVWRDRCFVVVWCFWAVVLCVCDDVLFWLFVRLYWLVLLVYIWLLWCWLWRVGNICDVGSWCLLVWFCVWWVIWWFWYFLVCLVLLVWCGLGVWVFLGYVVGDWGIDGFMVYCWILYVCYVFGVIVCWLWWWLCLGFLDSFWWCGVGFDLVCSSGVWLGLGIVVCLFVVGWFGWVSFFCVVIVLIVVRSICGLVVCFGRRLCWIYWLLGSCWYVVLVLYGYWWLVVCVFFCFCWWFCICCLFLG